MKTDPKNLVFLTIQEAQKILDDNDPGYTINLIGNRGAIIHNPDGSPVCELTSKGVESFEAE